MARDRRNRFFDEWQKRVAARPATAGLGHAFLATSLAHAFQVLRVSASLWDGAGAWWPIHSAHSVSRFEVEHAVDFERGMYNARSFAQAAKTRRAVRGEHAGFSDLFVPITSSGETRAVIVTGPFSLARPTSADIAARWYALTERQGTLGDPEFTAYVEASLSTLVLQPTELERYEGLLERLASLLGECGSAERLAEEAHVLGSELEQTRSVEHVWEAVQSMIDDRFPLTWSSMGKLHELFSLGLGAAPAAVLVGLTVSRTSEPDSLDEALRRDALQRRSVELARTVGDVVAGRVGDHGVVFLLSGKLGAQRTKHTLSEVAQRVGTVASREFRLSVHFGAGVASRGQPLSGVYEAALAAAESALAQGVRFVNADPSADRAGRSLRQLRRELGRVFAHHPDSLAPRFERYLESVVVQSGYRLEAARGHLEAGFERLAEPLIGSGALDEKSFNGLCDALERSATRARTLNEVLEAYRRAVGDLAETLKRPTSARRDQGLRLALDFVRAHYAEPLDLKRLGRLAGMTPDYLSRLFRQREGVTLEHHVMGLRIERAKQLLADTGLAVGPIAQMCGFSSQQYFCRVFRRATRLTPVGYRRRVQPRRA